MTTTGDHKRSGILRGTLVHGSGTLLALALLPVCLALGVPFAGWAIGAVAVAGNRLVHLAVAHAVRNAQPVVLLGAMGFSMMGRALVTALALFFIGAELTGAGGDRAIGLDRPDLARVAVVVFLLGFTLDTAIETIRRAAQREQLAAADAAAATAVPRETTA